MRLPLFQALLLALAGGSAFAGDEGVSLNGRIYTDQYVFTRGTRAGNLEQSNLSAWLDLDAHTSNGFGARIIGQGDAFYRSIEDASKPSFRATLREGYASYLGTGIEVKIGQQIIPWGKSDGVNPTDYFTAKNLTLLNPDEEVRRTGAFAANLSYTPAEGNSPLTFQLVAQANAPQTKLLIPDQSIPGGIQFERYLDTPLPFQGRYEIGGKISLLKPDFDVSLSAFRGYSHFPQYQLNPGTLAVSPIYPGQTAVGADASFTAKQYIFRFESALLMPDNGKETDPAAGTVDRANALILNYQYRGNPGATFRLSYSNDHSDFSGDVFLIGYFGYGQDFLLRPQMGYTPVTNLKLTLGADLYGGNVSRPLGALRDRSHVFFETRYLF
ncbi:MAG: hypothetical protein EBX52_03350 [Proteobacteria bacterium]|nr:hypothetical protein [Pseudomonadota bacterium]